MATDSIQVLLLADVRLYREGLADVLVRGGSVGPVSTAADLDEALRALEDEPAQIVLIGLSAGYTVPACAALTRARPEARVVALAVDSTDTVLAAVEAGVAGYVPQDASLGDLVSTLQSVSRGEMPCSPRVAAELCRRLAQLAPYNEPALERPGLTVREREVFELVQKRFSNKEIADRLCIEVPTVKNHVHNVLDKLHVHKRDEAVAVLNRLGVLVTSLPQGAHSAAGAVGAGRQG
jgi:two-component system, NarL family, nitrate/nitrite response regulator NarL